MFISQTANCSLKQQKDLQIEQLETRFLRLTNTEERTAYEEYCKSTNSTVTSLALAFILGILNFVFYGFAINEAHLDYFLICSLALTIIFRLPLFTFVIYTKIRLLFSSTDASPMSTMAVDAFENFYAVSACLSIGMSLLARVIRGRCEDGRMWSCNAEDRALSLPQEHIFILMLCPLLFSVVFRVVKWESICISWVLVVAFSVMCIVVSEAFQSIPLLFLYIITSSFMLCENQKQRLHEYFANERLKVCVSNAENQVNTEREQELKRMVGNLAHDLKTPLSAFVTGVESVRDMVRECIAHKESKTLSSARLTELLREMAEGLLNASNINAFMVMTINRCIDFTKATTGVKLVPHNETVDFINLVNIPVKIMQESQSRIAIRLNPIPKDICSHIITDQQWLQENLLCLLSNAVKYSNKGPVTVSVRLVRTTAPARSVASQSLNGGSPNRIQHRNSEGGSSHGSPDHSLSIGRGLTGKKSSFGFDSIRSQRPRIFPMMPSGNSSMTLATSSGKYVASTPNSLHIPNLNSDSSDTFNQQTEGAGQRGFLLQSFHADTSKTVELHGQASLSLDAISEVHANKSPTARNINKTNKTADLAAATVTVSRLDSTSHDADLNVASPLDEQSVWMIKIEIEDNGIGLSDEVMRNLYNPFKQAQKLAGGTGLGLYSLKQRLDSLKGKYGVTHRRDGQQGSMFWFAIPYKADGVSAESALSPEMSTKNSSILGTAGNGESLLHVRHDQLIEISDEGSSSSDSRHLQSDDMHKQQEEEDRPVRVIDENTLFDRITSVNHSKSVSADDNHAQFYLPSPAVMDSPALSLQGVSVQQQQQQVTSKSTSLHILLVDDAMSILKMTGSALRRKGHVVDTAENGSAAIDAITTRNNHKTLPPYDVVLMDLQMPVMDGLEAMRRIRRMESGRNSTDLSSPQAGALGHKSSWSQPRPRQKIIGLSANDGEDTQQEALQAGADVFVCKPITVEQFNALYASLLDTEQHH